MHSNRKANVLSWVLALAGALTLSPAVTAQQAGNPQFSRFPSLVRDMRIALFLLEEADKDYGGHKHKAQQAINRAINALPHGKNHFRHPRGGGEFQDESDA
jgi:hypothetical protein